MSRPKKDFTRTEIVRVRFTQAERRLLKSYAERSRMSIGEFLRARSLGYQIIPRLTEAEISYMRSLIGMSTNINTIAKKVHLGESAQLILAQLLIEINQQIGKLK